MLLLGRLGYLQGHLGKSLRAVAVKRRATRIVVPPRRGTILDRNDHPLAVSVYSGTISFDPVPLVKERDPKQCEVNQRHLDSSIAMVSDVTGITQDAVRAIVAHAEAEALSHPIHAKRSYVVVKDVSLDTANRFRAGRADLGRAGSGLIGFGLVDGSKRQYSSGAAAMQVVGYVGEHNEPLAGMEYSCQNWLAGRPGSLDAEVDRRNTVLPETVKRRELVQDGGDVHTTIDPYAQHLATEEAQKIFEQYHPHGGVSIVIVNPENGDLLALVSTPSLDPDPAERKKQNIDPRTDMRLVERCASVLYEPGSTLKALTVASALQAGTIDMNTRFSCSGALRVGNKSIHCPVYGPWDAHGHGSINCRDILKHSCNVGAAQIGMRMGPENLFDADARFGLFDPLNIELPYTRTGLLSYSQTEHKYTMAKAARVAFGHSMVTTPVHLAMAYAAIANGGRLMRPRLVTEITDSKGVVLKSNNPQVVRQVISETTSANMTDMLCDVVERGTGKTAAIRGYRIAGKTGTAKKYQPGKYTASFIGYLPASPRIKPRAVILVVVDEPQAGPHYGAQVAAPAFHSIAAQLMSYYKVPEDDPVDSQFKSASMGLRHDHDAPRTAVTHVTAL
jgi:stage V sporulation protein D (sporulation-specific penicillin-binding protein)